jgi:hypothetical protein
VHATNTCHHSLLATSLHYTSHTSYWGPGRLAPLHHNNAPPHAWFSTPPTLALGCQHVPACTARPVTHSKVSMTPKLLPVIAHTAGQVCKSKPGPAALHERRPGDGSSHAHAAHASNHACCCCCIQHRGRPLLHQHMPSTRGRPACPALQMPCHASPFCRTLLLAAPLMLAPQPSPVRCTHHTSCPPTVPSSTPDLRQDSAQQQTRLHMPPRGLHVGGSCSHVHCLQAQRPSQVSAAREPTTQQVATDSQLPKA